MRPLDLTGQRFGRLTAIERIGSTERGSALWRCKCDCGNEKAVSAAILRSGNIKSCGCFRSEYMSATRSSHRMTGTRIYKTWLGVKSRCYRKGDKEYANYGGRGIKVCEEWHTFEPFYEWAMNSGYADGLTIDRINVNGDYTPENCRWATRKEQSNNKRTCRMITYNGETKNLTQWAEMYEMRADTLSYRLRKGWDIERALTEKVKERSKT